MKLGIRIISYICLPVVLCYSCSDDNKAGHGPGNCDELKTLGIIDSFPYPVRPGSEQWNDLKNQDEIYKAVSVPEDTLNKMCTRGLVYTCVYCPILGQLSINNDIRTGFISLCNNVNSFRELTLRVDAGTELFDYYIKLTDTTLNNIKPLKYQAQMYLTELFFSQQEFLSELNGEYQDELLLKAYNNLLINEKLEAEELFYVGNLYLAANILFYNFKYQPIIDFIENNNPGDIFNNTLFWNEEIIDSLRFYTEKYIAENLK